MRAAAVLGDGASLAEAAALAGLSEEEAAGAGDLLVARGILTPAELIEFAHPIVREAVYADIGPRQRARAHAQAARLLHASGAAEERVAAQIAEAPPEGNQLRVELLRARRLRRPRPRGAGGCDDAPRTCARRAAGHRDALAGAGRARWRRAAAAARLERSAI